MPPPRRRGSSCHQLSVTRLFAGSQQIRNRPHRLGNEGEEVARWDWRLLRRFLAGWAPLRPLLRGCQGLRCPPGALHLAESSWSGARLVTGRAGLQGRGLGLLQLGLRKGRGGGKEESQGRASFPCLPFLSLLQY